MPCSYCLDMVKHPRISFAGIGYPTAVSGCDADGLLLFLSSFVFRFGGARDDVRSVCGGGRYH